MERVAILSNRENSAISHVLRPVAEALDIDLHYYPYETLGDVERYDLVHVGYIGLVDEDFLNRCAMTSVNVWNIAIDKIVAWNDAYKQQWDHFVVDDTTTLQIFGQLGATNVSLIPLAFDPAPFQPIPPPSSEFTVGVFCNDYPSKRYGVVFEACRLADVKCFAQIMDSQRTLYNIDPVRDFYRHVHVVAHASLTDTNSMPVQEGLLCGRPALTTHNFGVHRVLRDGFNGYFHDGSVNDLAEKIILAATNYEALRVGTRATPPPPLDEAIYGYKRLFDRLLSGEELSLVQRKVDADTAV
jgi:glycosyltransferase involved in cell wall biosynthesis